MRVFRDFGAYTYHACTYCGCCRLWGRCDPGESLATKKKMLISKRFFFTVLMHIQQYNMFFTQTAPACPYPWGRVVFSILASQMWTVFVHWKKLPVRNDVLKQQSIISVCPLSPSSSASLCFCLAVSVCMFLFLYMWMSIFLFVSCSWSPSLSFSHSHPPVCPSIHHQLMHYPVQLKSGPNLASGPYLCTVSRTWRLTVMQVLFFIRWLCCSLTFLALRGALAVDLFLSHRPSVCDTQSSNDSNITNQVNVALWIVCNKWHCWVVHWRNQNISVASIKVKS